MTPATWTGLAAFLAQTSPTGGDDLWRLGVIAVAVIVGAAGTYRYSTLPERARAERAEERADQAEREKTEAYKTTLPALAQTEALADRMLAVLPSVTSAAAGKDS